MQNIADKQLASSTMCGRILRGISGTDFVTLSNDPKRKIVMLAGPDGIQHIRDLPGYQMLEACGYMPSYIVELVAKRTVFKLVIFADNTLTAPATWQTMLALAGEVYPAIRYVLEQHMAVLARTPYQQLQKQAGFDFAQVASNGEGDQRFMTYERYLSSDKTPGLTRAFLQHTLYMCELYSGDGYTYRADGMRGLQEYATRNRPLESFGTYELLDISPVVVPVTKA
jgi:hypothetical protein